MKNKFREYAQRTVNGIKHVMSELFTKQLYERT